MLVSLIFILLLLILILLYRKSSRISKLRETGSRRRREERQELSSPGEELPLIPKGFLEQRKKQEQEEERARGQEEGSLKPIDPEEQKEIEGKLKMFRRITENHYLCPRKINKQSKKMQCDCTLSRLAS